MAKVPLSLLLQQLCVSAVMAGFFGPPPFGGTRRRKSHQQQQQQQQQQQHLLPPSSVPPSSPSPLLAEKPARLAENADGPLFVNDRCINCEACAGFAPATFAHRAEVGKHAVRKQPESAEELDQARAAMAACPVAAIRVETRQDRAPPSSAVASGASEDAPANARADADGRIAWHMSRSGEAPGGTFPRPLFQDEPRPVTGVYWTGHHNEASFGAVPYLVEATHVGEPVWIMVDCPKFSQKAVADVVSLTGDEGPRYLLLTHTDDTADHGKWARRFARHGLREIFHEGDLGRYNWLNDESLERVDILLRQPSPELSSDSNPSMVAYSLDGEVLPKDWPERWEAGEILPDSDAVVLHTPGHSPGSISLYRRPFTSEAGGSPGVVFTGDTYAWTEVGGGDGRMTGFGRYGYDPQADLHIRTLSKLLDLDWEVVAAGHGHSRDYRGADASLRRSEMKRAQDDLVPFIGWSKRREVTDQE